MLRPEKLDPTITVGDNLMYNFVVPNPATITVEMLAHSISKLCRFTGHIKRDDVIYSVAEHCVLVRLIAGYFEDSPQVLLDALMHDAHEAFVGDVSSPLKSLIRDAYRPLERKAEAAVAVAFSLTPLANRAPIVKLADTMAYLIERDTIMPRLLEGHPEYKYIPWPEEYKAYEKTIRTLFKMKYLEPKGAKVNFLRHFESLVEARRLRTWPSPV